MKLSRTLLILSFLMLAIGIIAQEKKVIVIDPGHGGSDSGAIGINGIYEKDINLAIGMAILRLNTYLLKNTYDMYLTRYTDTLISLRHRGKLAKVLRANFFISIHCNHAKNRDATGIEVYLHRGTPRENNNQRLASQLAQSLIGVFTNKLGYRIRGIKNANFQVLRESIGIGPSVLVELGFLSNVDEAGHLESKANMNALALAILMAIENMEL